MSSTSPLSPKHLLIIRHTRDGVREKLYIREAYCVNFHVGELASLSTMLKASAYGELIMDGKQIQI